MKKVYVVDDDRDIVEFITVALEHEGWEVASQHTEDDLEDNVVNFGPDAVVLDVMFPENESAGFEMARALRADSRTAEIPILMLSAVNARGSYAGTFSNRDRDDSFLPVNEFVEKPIKPAELIQKLNALFVD